MEIADRADAGVCGHFFPPNFLMKGQERGGRKGVPKGREVWNF